MGSSFLGAMLVLILLILCLGRVFFARYNKIDSLVVASPVALFISVLQIIAWGAGVVNNTLLILSFITVLLNFRALLRYTGGLLIDHYSIPFIFFSIVLLIVTMGVVAILILLNPLVQNPTYYKNACNGHNIDKRIIKLSGTFQGGLLPSKTFERADGVVTVFNSVSDSSNITDFSGIKNFTGITTIKSEKDIAGDSETKDDDLGGKKDAIILLGDKRAGLENYLPYIYRLTREGKKVYYGDFWTRDGLWAHNLFDSPILRRGYLRARYFFNPKRFESEKEFFSFNISRELKFLYNYIKEVEGDKRIFVITDWMGEIAAEDFQKELGEDESFLGVKKLSLDDDYKTKGFGNTNLTEPLVSVWLKMTREHYASPIEAALAVIKEIKEGGIDTN